MAHPKSTIVHQLKAQGQSEREIAEQVGIGRATVRRILAEPPPAEIPNSTPDGPPTLSERLIAIGMVLKSSNLPAESATCLEAAGRIGALENIIAPEDEADEGPTDPVEIARRSIQRDQAAAEYWTNAGNPAAASRHSRNVVMSLPVLARLESAARAEAQAGGTFIPDASIAGRMLEIDALVVKHLDRPQLCARCNCALSACWADGGETADFMRNGG